MFKDLVIVDRNTLLPLADLDTETASVAREINGEFVMTFTTPLEELKTEYIKGNSVEADDQTYDIVYYEKSGVIGGVELYSCESWHVFYRLKKDEYKYISYVFLGTPAQILDNLLTGTDFTVGIVEFTDSINFTVNEEKTTAQLIIDLANLLGGELEYTAKGFEINILDTIGQNNGFEISDDNNILAITELYDEREGLDSLGYEVDLIESSESDQYILLGYDQLEGLNLGDSVYLIKKSLDIDTVQRVVKIKYDPRRRKNTSIEIAENILLFTDSVNTLTQTAVTKEKSYYGITITPENGLVVERSDLKARSVFNADTWSADKGDGLGNYEQIFFFNVIDEDWEYRGNLKANSFEGGSIDIGAGTFIVDEFGNCTANSLTIGGGSGIGNLSDAGLLAEADYVDMSTGDVINKIADNIQESITRKWAAESGADVTGNNTALNIFGQGLLATQDDVTVSQISDAGLLASLDSISSTYIDNEAVITPKLAAGSVVASKMAVGQLSAISADLGTVNAGTINGLDVFANQFTAEKYVEINSTVGQGEGLILKGFVDMYAYVFDPAGTMEIGPFVRVTNDLRVGDDLTVVDDASIGGVLTVGGSTVITEITGDINYCQNVSTQKMGFQENLAGTGVEVFVNNSFKGLLLYD
jgi:hypothetical protein